MAMKELDTGGPMASASGYYHYQDAEGVEVIVQRLEEVPAKYRAMVKRLDLGEDPAPATPSDVQMERASRPSHDVALGKEFWASIHWPSFAVGVAISLTAGMLFVVLLRRRSRVLSMLVGALAMMAFAVGYLTLLRNQVGIRSTGLATPATVIDEARAAAATAQKRHAQQGKTLDQINNMR